MACSAQKLVPPKNGCELIIPVGDMSHAKILDQGAPIRAFSAFLSITAMGIVESVTRDFDFLATLTSAPLHGMLRVLTRAVPRLNKKALEGPFFYSNQVHLVSQASRHWHQLTARGPPRRGLPCASGSIED